MATKQSEKPQPGPQSGARKALVVSIMIPVVAVLTVAVASGAFLPQISAEAGRESRAAVAIRDDVTPFQKWGTRAFTYGQLAASDDHVEHITQASGDQKHAVFVTALEGALENYEVVDLFLLAHTNSYIDWVSEIDPGLRRRIRFVYNTGCWGTDQAEVGSKEVRMSTSVIPARASPRCSTPTSCVDGFEGRRSAKLWRSRTKTRAGSSC